MAAPVDPSSASSISSHAVSHYDLGLAVDPRTQSIRGVLSLTVERRHVHASSLTLDCRDIGVQSVSVAAITGQDVEVPFSIAPFASFGDKLIINLPDTSVFGEGIIRVTICFNAGAGPALCWLTKEQTADGTHPFLFTQGQAALNRSFFPCQDTPSTRATYSACIAVPKPFTALMSARMTGEVTYPVSTSDAEAGPGLSGAVKGDACFLSDPYAPGRLGAALAGPIDKGVLARIGGGGDLVSDPEEWHAFTFDQPLSIPVYLVALVVGHLQCAEIGPRSRVWAEHSMIAPAAWEYGHGGITERYLSTAERLFGPYRWGRYDVVVLPPAFPYGGMENPNLTTLNPKTVAGDQSLSDVLCHEIIHSWFGNNVTNRSWSEFFLNEGFTMFAQRRVTQEVHGKAFTALETTTGRELLGALLRDVGADSPLTRLVVPLTEGIDPDDTYTEAPYEKGFAFVSYLSKLAGKGDAGFDGWLAAYVATFAFSCISAVDMLQHYCDHFGFGQLDGPSMHELGRSFWSSSVPAPLPGSPAPVFVPSEGTSPAFLPGYELARWLHQPGWPPYYPDLSAASELTAPAEALAAAWQAAATAAAISDTETAHVAHAPTDASTFLTWPTYQRLHFLDCLQNEIVRRQQVQMKADDLRAVFVEAHALLAGLESAYGLGTAGNAEIRVRWCQLVARAQWTAGYESLRQFMRSTGKQKYTLPVYRALLALPAAPLPSVGSAGPAAGPAAGRRFAETLFAETMQQLHVSVRGKVQALLDDSAGVDPQC